MAQNPYWWPLFAREANQEVAARFLERNEMWVGPKMATAEQIDQAFRSIPGVIVGEYRGFIFIHDKVKDNKRMACKPKPGKPRPK